MWLIPFVIEVSKLAIVAIILFYVVEMIAAMPQHIRRIVQALILLIVILTVLQMAVSQGRATTSPIYSPPSIMAPAK